MTPADHTMRCISLTIRARLRLVAARYRFKEACMWRTSLPIHNSMAWWNSKEIWE